MMKKGRTEAGKCTLRRWNCCSFLSQITMFWIVYRTSITSLLMHHTQSPLNPSHDLLPHTQTLSASVVHFGAIYLFTEFGAPFIEMGLFWDTFPIFFFFFGLVMEILVNEEKMTTNKSTSESFIFDWNVSVRSLIDKLPTNDVAEWMVRLEQITHRQIQAFQYSHSSNDILLYQFQARVFQLKLCTNQYHFQCAATCCTLGAKFKHTNFVENFKRFLRFSSIF